MWRKGNHSAWLVEMQTGAATVENSIMFPQKKLKMKLPFDPVILLTISSMFIAVLFIVTKIWKQPKCPSVNEMIKQLWYIYPMEYYSAIKKNKILTFATVWIDLKIFR